MLQTINSLGFASEQYTYQNHFQHLLSPQNKLQDAGPIILAEHQSIL